MALLFGAVLQLARTPPVQITTFGSPRVAINALPLAGVPGGLPARRRSDRDFAVWIRAPKASYTA